MTDFRGNRGPEKPDYVVGDKLQITLQGQIFEGVVKSVVEKTDGKKYNVSFDGGNHSAMVAEWPIAK